MSQDPRGDQSSSSSRRVELKFGKGIGSRREFKVTVKVSLISYLLVLIALCLIYLQSLYSRVVLGLVLLFVASIKTMTTLTYKKLLARGRAGTSYSSVTVGCRPSKGTDLNHSK